MPRLKQIFQFFLPFLILGIVALLFWGFTTFPRQPTCGLVYTQHPPPFINYSSAPSAVQNGRSLFKNNCAPCHFFTWETSHYTLAVDDEAGQLRWIAIGDTIGLPHEREQMLAPILNHSVLSNETGFCRDSLRENFPHLRNEDFFDMANYILFPLQ